MTSLALAIATKGKWDPQKLLAALAEAGIDASTDVHVACDPAHLPKATTAGLSVHSRPDASLFDLWGLAIEQANADWIAILHADAMPAAGWFAALTAAIKRDDWSDGYWGPVEPGFGRSDARMIGYLTEYVQFNLPIATGMKEVPGSNLVLPRQRTAGGDFSKTRLLDEGLAPRLVEAAKVRYARPINLGEYCARRFRHGRSYAAKRTPKVPVLKAVPLALVLPVVRTARVLGNAWHYPKLRAAALGWLPAIFVAETYWSAGELVGYLTRNPGNRSGLA